MFSLFTDTGERFFLITTVIQIQSGLLRSFCSLRNRTKCELDRKRTVKEIQCAVFLFWDTPDRRCSNPKVVKCNQIGCRGNTEMNDISYNQATIGRWRENTVWEKLNLKKKVFVDTEYTSFISLGYMKEEEERKKERKQTTEKTNKHFKHELLCVCVCVCVCVLNRLCMLCNFCILQL